MVEIVVPTRMTLTAYQDALERGWSPDNVRGADAAAEQLSAIRADPDAFLRSLDDPEARGEPIKLPDGRAAKRLPSIIRWIWDDNFCGSIGFRWQNGTPELPPNVLGHIGFAVVPWRRRRGYAKKGLGLMLNEARRRELRYVELTTSPDNLASQKVITANGGTLMERFRKEIAFGGGEALRFRIDL